MQLLSALYEGPWSEEERSDLSTLAPRLFPFFRHTLTSVRAASVACLSLLLEGSPAPAQWLLSTVLHPALLLTFQNLTIETEPEIVQKSKVTHPSNGSQPLIAPLDSQMTITIPYAAVPAVRGGAAMLANGRKTCQLFV